MSDDNDFEQGDAGASINELAEAGRMKPGSLIIMKDVYPCKVTAFSTTKHGSTKAMITAKDIFTDKQNDETFGTGDMIPRPIVSKTEMQVIGYEDDQVTIMTPEGELKEDLNFPTEAHLSDLRGKIIAIVDAGAKECLV